MIATDSSTLIAHFNDENATDVDKLRSALQDGKLVLPPVVITEVLTDPGADAFIEARIGELVQLAMDEGYWRRAGHARRLLIEKGFKARVADSLIAQSCIDHDIPLITRDKDFRHFARHCGLRLA